jgi:hypothetical protein
MAIVFSSSETAPLNSIINCSTTVSILDILSRGKLFTFGAPTDWPVACCSRSPQCVLSCTAVYVVSHILGKRLLNVPFHGYGWFRSKDLVSTSLHSFSFVSMDTFVENPAMVCVHGLFLRGNVFARSFPRSGLHATIRSHFNYL